MSEFVIRQMQQPDVEPADAVLVGALADLARRRGEAWTERTGIQTGRSLRRLRHLLSTDPDGAWVAEVDGEVAGVGMGLRREGLWGLSLLMVQPGAQGRGIGRQLLERALRYADGCQRGIIVSSPDPAAIRRYGLAGFRLLPGVTASGSVQRAALQPAPGVRPGTADDLELAAEVDRQIRGAAHGPDLEMMAAEPSIGMLVLDGPAGRGYTMMAEGKVMVLAATTPAAAQRLLWATLALEPDDGESLVPYLAGDQTWAVEVALAAGLAIKPGGPLFVRGEVGPLTPYIPSGMFL